MLDRRKAFIGYIVYIGGKTIAKRAVKSKAKSATPGKRGGVIAGTIAGLGAALGGLMFWRKRRKSEESFQS
jgi:hypothetical protein